MRISDWSSDVCSSDLQEDQAESILRRRDKPADRIAVHHAADEQAQDHDDVGGQPVERRRPERPRLDMAAAHKQRCGDHEQDVACGDEHLGWTRSEEQTSELQSLMRISYAVFCLKK